MLERFHLCDLVHWEHLVFLTELQTFALHIHSLLFLWCLSLSLPPLYLSNFPRDTLTSNTQCVSCESENINISFVRLSNTLFQWVHIVCFPFVLFFYSSYFFSSLNQLRYTICLTNTSKDANAFSKMLYAWKFSVGSSTAIDILNPKDMIHDT